MIATLAVGELVEDLRLYPRTQVSGTNVTNLVAALEAGVTLPPPIADEASKRIVDGFHRRQAYLRMFGPSYAIPVELRRYASEAEIYRDAVSLNAAHGLPLQSFEKRKVALRLRDEGVDDRAIAVVLHTTPDRIEKICLRVATVTQDNGSVRLEPLKRPLFHFQGLAMTEQQAKVHKSAPGTSYLLIVQQLRDALRHNMVDGQDRVLMETLRELAVELDQYI